MVESMIERVARAMFDASRKDAALRGVQASWDMYPLKDAMLDMARAAIKAMRVPTEAMVDACGTNYHQYEIYDNWQAMIDAALNEQVSD